MLLMWIWLASVNTIKNKTEYVNNDEKVEHRFKSNTGPLDHLGFDSDTSIRNAPNTANNVAISISEY